MKKFLVLTILTLALVGVGFTQEDSKQTKKEMPAAQEKNTSRVIEGKSFEYAGASKSDAGAVIKRGAGIGAAKKVKLTNALKTPEKYAGKMVFVEGVIVRSCKMEGCWMEIAPLKEAKSVRVTFKNHAFFIPLDAAGMHAKAEGVFTVKNLSKAEVEHLVNEDGAKFDNVNKDGTVTEIRFEATGVELTK